MNDKDLEELMAVFDFEEDIHSVFTREYKVHKTDYGEALILPGDKIFLATEEFIDALKVVARHRLWMKEHELYK